MHEQDTPDGHELLDHGDASGIAREAQAGDPVVDAPGDHPAESVPTKVCAHCSVQSQTIGAFCPNCGKAFDRSRGSSKRALRLAGIAVAAVVLLGGGGAAIALTNAHNSDLAAQKVATQIAKDANAAKDAEAARVAADAQAKEAADAAERAMRATSVIGIEKSITKDAQSRVKDGSLDGPITKTSCSPLGGGSTDNLTALTTTFTCIAINKENSDGSASGYSFSATMDWDSGSYTWQLGN
jgi:hypothetical protein